MKLINILNEAPIEDFQTIGDFNKSHSMRNLIDRRLVTNPHSVEKIKNMWSKCEIPFNMYYVNLPGAANFVEHGIVELGWLQKNLPKVHAVLATKNIDDAVHVIFTNNLGSERVPLTGWIQAHRFAHALVAGYHPYGEVPYTKYSVDEFRKNVRKKVCEILSEGYRLPFKNLDEYDFNTQNKLVLAFLHGIGTFKSARDKKIRASFEFYNELIAQYIITGGIRFNPLPEIFKYRNTTHKLTDNQENREHAQWLLDGMAEMAEHDIEVTLHAAVGKIFVM